MNPFDEVIDYLTYMKEVGLTTLTLEEDTLASLSAMISSEDYRKAPVQPVGNTLAHHTYSPADTSNANVSASIGQSHPNAPSKKVMTELMIVGETEACEGGKYGELLMKMIGAMGFSPSEITITNICGKSKSVIPPTLEEMKAAMPAFRKKVSETAPRAILLLGSTAALGLLGSRDISSIHGRWFKFEGIPLLPTFHPAYLMKYPSAKKIAWFDMQRVMLFLGKKPRSGEKK